MDPERRRFLEEALNSMTVNVIEQLEMAAQVLTTNESSEAEQVEAIEIILDYVDNMDTANDFCKIGGLNIILPCMASSPYASVRSKSASLIAELSQNNPFSQKMLLELNVLPKLIELLSDSETSTAAIRAISCVVRSYEPCAAAFIDMGGLECILGCLQSDEEKLLVQSLFLMCSLCTEYPGVRDEFVKLKAVEQIIELLRPASKFDVRLEATLCAMNILTENVEAASRCRESHLNVRSTLQDIIKEANNKPECQVRVFCDDVKEILFTNFLFLSFFRKPLR